MNYPIHIDTQLWAALLAFLFIGLAILLAYYLGTTEEDRKVARAYKKRMEYLESKLPRVQKARVS